MRKFLRECKVKDTSALIESLVDLNIESLEQLSSIPEEKDDIEKQLKSNKDITPGDFRKFMSGIQVLWRPIKDKYMQIKGIYKDIMKKGGPRKKDLRDLMWQITAREEDDYQAVEQPRRIIREFFAAHPDCQKDAAGVDPQKLLECKQQLQECLKDWLRGQNAQFDLHREVTEENVRIYQNIFEFFTWLDITEEIEMERFDCDCLKGLDLKLKAFPQLRQCLLVQF